MRPLTVPRAHDSRAPVWRAPLQHTRAHSPQHARGSRLRRPTRDPAWAAPAGRQHPRGPERRRMEACDRSAQTSGGVWRMARTRSGVPKWRENGPKWRENGPKGIASAPTHEARRHHVVHLGDGRSLVERRVLLGGERPAHRLREGRGGAGGCVCKGLRMRVGVRVGGGRCVGQTWGE